MRDPYGKHLRKVVEHVAALPPSEQRIESLTAEESYCARHGGPCADHPRCHCGRAAPRERHSDGS